MLSSTNFFLAGVVLASLVAIVQSEGGGMAELKAITGDAPYLGAGNAPAFVPQPQGFWGRSRFTPYSRFGNNYYGNNIGAFGSPFGGGLGGGFGRAGFGGGAYPDRFASISGSPFGETGFPLTDFGKSSAFAASSNTFSANRRTPPTFRSGSSLFDSLADSFNLGSGSHSLGSVSPLTSPTSGSTSLSAATGGFYKGRGNSFVNQ